MCQYHCGTWDEPSSFEECEDAKKMSWKLHEVDVAVRDVVKLLYMSGELDVAMLDDAVGRICDAVGCKCPVGLPQVRRQGSELFELAATLHTGS